MSRFDLDLYRDFVLEVLLPPDIDLKLINRCILTNNSFYSTWIDVGAANELHVVPTSPDTTTIEVPGTSTRAGASRNFHDHILRAISNNRNETPSEGGHHTLAKFSIAYWLITLGSEHLFDEMIFDDMGTARLV